MSLCHPTRRGVVAALITTAAALAAAPAFSQSYPTKPIRLVVAYPAGGVTDLLARKLATVLGDQLQQPVVVENRVGGNTLIATQFVAAAPADGHTLFLTDLSQLSYNAYFYKQQPYDFERDFVPITSVGEIPLALAVNAQLPVNTLGEFVTYAKANPGKLNYASSAIGGPPHLGMEHLKLSLGADLVHVPYKGGAPAIADLIGGQVQAIMNEMSTPIQFVRAGKIKVLAISGARRMPKLPDVPTFAELGQPGLSVSALMGVVAPAQTPAAIVEKLNANIRQAVATPSLAEFMDTNNIMVRTNTSAELKAAMAGEQRRWRDLIKALNLDVN